ncbi:Phosphotyrosyl phosphatase activator [Xylariaceae sp. FL0255]|nr:Phosphotyrosyl phosphatase activator [Xylariaceae sp. FL0255]
MMNPPPPDLVLETLGHAAPHTFVTPTKQIHDAPDVAKFLTSQAYRDIGIFVLQLNRAMCPRKFRDADGKDQIRSFLIGSEYETKPIGPVRKLQDMLANINSLIDEVPPHQGPRRFGNIAFRTWYQLLQQRIDALLAQNLPDAVSKFPAQAGTAADELKAYLLGAFGSAQRLDYGTGHELSFLAFLGGLWKLGAFRVDSSNGDIERSIVLGVFEPYLRVVRRLIITYTLEPAGSHGVWGLDDHSFQPYIYGSAQLTRAITDSEPMPTEGSVFRAPKTSSVVKSEYVEEERKRNLYFSAIGFINDVKKGPFWEHSPMLFDISGVKDGWGKINKGMIKMFNAEVLSKFPVVQHFPFGSLFSWEQDSDAVTPQPSAHITNLPVAPSPMAPPSARSSGTPAPWASGSGLPTVNASVTRAPWVSNQPTPRQPQLYTQRQQPTFPHPADNASASPSAPWTGSSDGPSS